MLAYELYLNNKESKTPVVKAPKLLKKIYVNEDKVGVDSKALEEYGSNVRYDFLQEWLSMPMNTADEDLLNLPYRGTGTRSPSPYVKIYGKCVINKSKKYIALNIYGKDSNNIKLKKSFDSELDLLNFTETLSTATDQIILNIEKKKYRIGNGSLFDSYVDAQIIKDDGRFNGSLFNAISKSFFQYVKQRPLPQEKYPPLVNTSFEIFVLPNDKFIAYTELDSHSSNREYFIDSFGMNCSLYDSKPTQNAKFLSFYYPAFTINCKEGNEFYMNLGIGKESVEKINIPVKNVFTISGLKWMFVDISNPFFNFQDVNKGIIAQLYQNYRSLVEQSRDVYHKQLQMKVICYKRTQAKIEILIDENLTMDRMKHIIERSNHDEGYPFSFEDILIDKSSKKPIQRDYLNAIQKLITGTYLEKNRLLQICFKKLRLNLHKWIEGSSKWIKEAKRFFVQSDFCFKTLLERHKNLSKMNSDEEYAYSVGLIAGRYVRFKNKSEKNNNSLRDILTYSKYDRDKLRTVFKRIGLGVNLSKAKQPELDKMSLFIKNNDPKEDISEDKQFDDYSYFFYKGVFQEIS